MRLTSLYDHLKVYSHPKLRLAIIPLENKVGQLIKSNNGRLAQLVRANWFTPNGVWSSESCAVHHFPHSLGLI